MVSNCRSVFSVRRVAASFEARSCWRTDKVRSASSLAWRSLIKTSSSWRSCSRATEEVMERIEVPVPVVRLEDWALVEAVAELL